MFRFPLFCAIWLCIDLTTLRHAMQCLIKPHQNVRHTLACYPIQYKKISSKPIIIVLSLPFFPFPFIPRFANFGNDRAIVSTEPWISCLRDFHQNLIKTSSPRSHGSLKPFCHLAFCSRHIYTHLCPLSLSLIEPKPLRMLQRDIKPLLQNLPARIIRK